VWCLESATRLRRACVINMWICGRAYWVLHPHVTLVTCGLHVKMVSRDHAAYARGDKPLCSALNTCC
jgi:hypothetical protein